jgi:hypothetical protein
MRGVVGHIKATLNLLLVAGTASAMERKLAADITGYTRLMGAGSRK